METKNKGILCWGREERKVKDIEMQNTQRNTPPLQLPWPPLAFFDSLSTESVYSVFPVALQAPGPVPEDSQYVVKDGFVELRAA